MRTGHVYARLSLTHHCQNNAEGRTYFFRVTRKRFQASRALQFFDDKGERGLDGTEGQR